MTVGMGFTGRPGTAVAVAVAERVDSSISATWSGWIMVSAGFLC